MGLPIALGGKTVSSRRLAPPSPEEVVTGEELQPRILESPSWVTMTVSKDLKLSITCSISYYEMVRNSTDHHDDVDHRIAELRIQIAPLGESYSSRYRDTLHRITLPELTQNTQSSTHPVQPSIVLANDGRNMACIIPHSQDASQSVVVTFQLRKPRSPASTLPPRPSYLGPNTAVLTRIATNPRVLHQDDSVVTTACCVCDVATYPQQQPPGSLSMLLVGCVDGTIYAASYRPARTAGRLFQTNDGGVSSSIASMAHITTSWDPDDGARGRLVALLQPSGLAVLFQSHIVHSDSAMTKKETVEDDTTSPKADDAHFLIHTEPAIDLDGPFVKAKWMTGSYLALLCRPDHRSSVAGEVWALAPSLSDPAEPISTLTMNAERLEECQHGTYSIGSNESEEAQQEQQWDEPPLPNAMCMEYDEESGCLAVSSLVHDQHSAVRPFSCIWNWRTNVVGLTLAARETLINTQRESLLLSQLYFGKDMTGGNRIVHCIACLKRDGQKEECIRKEIYEAGILSPASSVNAKGICHLEASSLMLSSKSVGFPMITKPLTGDDGEVVWTESRIPTHYTSRCGPPCIATIGRKRGRSIAVAGSRGLCVLDCTRALPPALRTGYKQLSGNETGRGDPSGKFGVPKWRMFGSEAEERSFRVLALTWWESDSLTEVGNDEGFSDDLLVALVQEPTEDGQGRVYLSCWSRRGLNMQSQLLHSVQGKRANNPPSGIGLVLPDIPKSGCSISLLSEPMTSLGYSGDRKAVVLISFHDGDGSERQDNSYFLYHLHGRASEHTARRTSADLISSVHAEVASHGRLPTLTNGCSTGAFLAGCSFQFDLTKPKPSHGDSHRFLATLGIVNATGKGIDVVAVTSSGVNTPAHVIFLGGADNKRPLKSCEVAGLWQSGTVANHESISRSALCSFFAWTVMMRDGNLFCWTVPNLDARREMMVVSDAGVDFSSHAQCLEKDGLLPPVFLCASDDPDAALPLLFGTVAYIGDSSTWLQEASHANRVQFSLGCLPGSEFGCILRATQGSRDLHRVAPAGADDEMSGPSLLDHEIFFIGDTTMAPPAFVSSFFAILLASANENALRISEGGSVPRAWDFQAMKQMTILSVKAYAAADTITTALRVLILRVVEIVARESEKSRTDSAMLATSLFSELVDAARSLVTPMQFVALFLGVARQIEPSCIPHLFPLPSSTSSFRSNAQSVEGWRSVNDLFLASLYHGSLSSPSSALPLFSSKRITLLKCVDLLKHCLLAFEESACVEAATLQDAYREERGAIRDLFLFGSKLENAGLSDERPSQRQTIRMENGGLEENSLSTAASSFVNVKPPQARATKGRRSICSLLLPSILTGKYQRAHEEDAIHEAASSFISSGFEESDFEFVPLTQASVPLEISYEDACDVSVAGAIVDFLLSLCLDRKPIKPYYRWKKARALAQIVVGEDNKRASFDIRSPLVIGFKNLAALIPLSAFSVLAKATSRKHDELVESKQLVAELLAEKIVECEDELDSNDALLVLRLVCTLLARHEHSEDVESCISGIIFLGLVAGHVAGIAKDLLGTTFERSAIGSSYAVALHDLSLRQVVI